jgi:tetratricopeptide (TPR) repeat protein
MAAVAALAVVCYLPSPSLGFVNWDDHWLILENPYLGRRDAATWAALWDPTGDRHAFGREYLPVRDLSWMLDHLIWDLDPRGYHLGNVVLHATASALLVPVLAACGVGAGAAALGAALFAAHPVHVEAVTWATGRKDVLSAALCLGALAAFTTRRRAGRAAAVGLTVLAMFAKYPAVVWPAVLLAWQLVAPGAPHTPLRSRWTRRDLAVFAPLGIAAVAVVVIGVRVAAANADSVLTVQPLMPTALARVATMAVVHLRYVGLLLWPAGLAPIHDVTTYTSVLAPAPLAGIALVMLAAAALPLVWRRDRRVAFLLILYGVTLLPVSGLVPLRIPMADRYLYLPSAAACALAGLALAAHTRWRWAGLGAGATALLVLAIATWHTQGIWRDDLTLWRAAAARAPRNPTALLGLADALRQSGDLPGAFARLREARAVLPPNGSVRPDLVAAWERHARALAGGGAVEAARRALGHAVKASPWPVLARWCASGPAPAPEPAPAATEATEARFRADCFLGVLSVAPDHAVLHADLSRALAHAGDLEGAARHYHKARDLAEAAADPQAVAHVGTLATDLLAAGVPIEPPLH